MAAQHALERLSIIGVIRWAQANPFLPVLDTTRIPERPLKRSRQVNKHNTHILTHTHHTNTYALELRYSGGPSRV